MDQGPEDESKSAESTAAVVSLLKDGDQRAVFQVRSRVSRILTFRGYGIPEQDRLDLEQTIMTELWQAVNRLDFIPGGFWGLVEVVASRRCIDWRRARKPEVALESVAEPRAPQANPLGLALEREQTRRARAVLARLPAACRELILLHAGQDRPYREIAEILGVSEAALRVRMHRCIRQAQALLREVQDRDP